jgi:hypothetical protein
MKISARKLSGCHNHDEDANYGTETCSAGFFEGSVNWGALKFSSGLSCPDGADAGADAGVDAALPGSGLLRGWMVACTRVGGSEGSAAAGARWLGVQTRGFLLLQVPLRLQRQRKQQEMVLHQLIWWMVTNLPKS